MSYFVDPETGAIWPFTEGKLCPDTNEWQGSTLWTEVYGARVKRVVYRLDGTSYAELDTEDEIIEVELYDTLQDYINEC